MASKTKKGSRSSSSSSSSAKEDTISSTKPWPDVPKQLLSIVERQSTLMNNFSYGGVTKSWRLPPSPKRCHSSVKLPQLTDITACRRGPHVSSKSPGPTFFDILFRVGEYWWWCRRWGRPRRKYYEKYDNFRFKGYSQGVVVGTEDEYPFLYQLWDPLTRHTQYLPIWDKAMPFKYVALSSSPFDANYSSSSVIMVVTGMSRPAFLFKGLEIGTGSYEWVKQDCTISDPYSSNNQLMEFTNVISFQGKFYALSLQGTLAVVEASSDCVPRITCLGKNRAVPGVGSKHFRECLLQSDGEILLVFLISRRSIKVVDYVEVYRLQFDMLSWEKLQELGDRTLFMGSNCCMSITSSSVGCRSNCVYFTQEEEGWWVFDMEAQIILPGWDTVNSTTKSTTWKEPERE